MQSEDFKTIKECRSCSSKELVDVLDLGLQPLANALVQKQGAPIKKFPLRTVFCPACSLFQLKETVKKEILFDSYFWVTGTSHSANEYARIFFERVSKLSQSQPNDFVLEIASNDGTFLKQFAQNGFNVLGVDPAENIAKIAEENGVKTLCSYWNQSTAQTVLDQVGKAQICFARNVIPHVSELHQVIQGMYDVLDENGVGIIEFHDGGVIYRELHYDSIYHEHLCYFTIKSITNLLNRHNLYPFHIDPSPISGGSHVIYFSKKQRPEDNSYVSALKKEEELHINDLVSWQHFAKTAIAHKNQTLELLSTLKNKKIVGFGASARSATYLNFCGLTSSEISCVIDNNALKQGLFAPGSDIPIVPFEEGLASDPDVIFMLAWNMKDELIRECDTAKYSGQYLLPFPQKPHLILSST